MKDSGLLLLGVGILIGVAVATLLIVVVQHSSTVGFSAPMQYTYVPVTKSLRKKNAV